MTPLEKLSFENGQLRREIDELRGEITQLRRDEANEAFAESVVNVQTRIGVSPGQAAILLILHRAYPRSVSKYEINEIAHDDNRDPPDVKVIDVQICRLRQRIGRDKIVTVWGRGYGLSEAGRQFVASVLAGENLGPAERTTRPPRSRSLTDDQVRHLRAAPNRQAALSLGAKFGASPALVDSVFYNNRYADVRSVGRP